jgi:branched-chain amino acid transport system ATP-binding protein
MSALELEGVEVAYGGVAAVRNLSLRVAPGEIVGLIGPNGAGKSTTLHAIMGAVSPAAGDIRWRNFHRGPHAWRVVREWMALVPEGRRIFAELTVEENLRLGSSGRRTREGGGGGGRDRLRALPIVEQTRGRQAGSSQAASSSSSRLREPWSRNPGSLLLDEPSLGLAPRVVDMVFDLLGRSGTRSDDPARRAAAQRTVAFADRTYVLANGEN